MYEHLHLMNHDAVPALEGGLHGYFSFYNHDRLHQRLGYRTPTTATPRAAGVEERRSSALFWSIRGPDNGANITGIRGAGPLLTIAELSVILFACIMSGQRDSLEGMEVI